MSSDCTPTLAEVRRIFSVHALKSDRVRLSAEFDRFINKVRADALREAANALPKPVGLRCNPECHTVDWASLRARADRIESGDGQ